MSSIARKLRVIVYRDKLKRIHRTDGPAVIGPKFECWYFEGIRLGSYENFTRHMERVVLREIHEEQPLIKYDSDIGLHQFYEMSWVLGPVLPSSMLTQPIRTDNL